MRSLALLLVALTGLIAFEGCGSDSPSGKTVAGTCSVAMCPPNAAGPTCCINNVCGVNPGNGCVPTGHPDAGH
jgi:hypothetical protein